MSGELLLVLLISASLVHVLSHFEIMSAPESDDYFNISPKMKHGQVTYVILKYNFVTVSLVKIY